MQEFLNDLIPNVMAKLPDFYAAIGDTLLMGYLVRSNILCSGADTWCAAYGHKTGGHP